jgi:hypothetical protein
VEKAIKEMRDKKATADDDVPGDVLKFLGEDCLRLITQLINPSPKLQISATIEHTAKIVARIYR